LEKKIMVKKSTGKTLEQKKAALQAKLKALDIQAQIKTLRDQQKALRKA
jgi:hypothetical protein